MKDIFCTDCGKRMEYMGVRKIRTKRGYSYNSATGQPFEEQWWQCPELKRWFASTYHNTRARLITSYEV